MRSTSPATPLILAILPWPAVWLALYVFHRAWLAFALYHGICFTSWLLFRTPLPPHRDVVWRPRHWIALGIACLALDTAVFLLARFFSTLLQPDRLQSALAKIHAASSIGGALALVSYFAFVNPVFEELFWRGTVYTRLRAARWPVARCAVVSGFLFGAWHSLVVVALLAPGVAVLSVAGVVAAGIAFAFLYERSRSLPAVMLLHGIGADVPILIVLWMDVLGRH